MRKELEIEVKEEVITLGADLIYMQKPYWCNAGFYPLKMSLIRPRSFFSYDKVKEPMPVIVWLAGGGWTEVDHNVWIPELTYFAKKGYLVASVSYSVSPTWTFPEPLLEVKQAIRYLRAHAGELNIDPDRIALMGESAGAHIAALVGTTGGMEKFEKGDYLEYSSGVQAVVLYYPPIDMEDFEGRGDVDSYNEKPQYLLRGELEPQSLFHGMVHVRNSREASREMDPRTYVGPDTPPCLMLHGTADTQVSSYHSEAMYKALKEAGAEAELYLIRGAEHADHAFVQPEIKELVLDFLQRHLNADKQKNNTRR